MNAEDFTTEQLLDVSAQYNLTGAIDLLVEKCAEPARDIRQAVSSFYTKSDIGFYWHPTQEKAGMFVRPQLDAQEFDWGLELLAEKFGADSVHETPLALEDLPGWWVKVAYSPTLRRIGEILQFFPSKDIPGFGGYPLASTLASGVMGAGLGYGTGWLAEKVLPRSWQQPGVARKSLAVLGGLAGTGLGATPGFVNWHQGRDFNDPTLWRHFLPESPTKDAGYRYKAASEQYVAKQAMNSSTIGGPSFEDAPLVSMDELGRVLWGTNANPQTTAMTMGAMYGASQMPDPSAQPGMVTQHQTGLFGMAMGAAGGGIHGYAIGRAVGAGLGMLTGMPRSTQETLGQSGAALGIINVLVPRLFR